MYTVPPVLIFGGTGSLGKTLVKRFLSKGRIVIVFSRDEAKQFNMMADFPNVQYVVGDIRNYESVVNVLRRYLPDVIVNAAAMKQVPICEKFPYEALMTNTVGTKNLVQAVEEVYATQGTNPKVLSVSTDKACKPVNSYGMTKALQERIHLLGRFGVFTCVRYGNVLESTGSVIPFFQDRIRRGLDLPITDRRMTRFLLSLEQAVDLIFTALEDMQGKKIFIPKVKSCLITTLAECMCDYYKQPHSKIVDGRIRPGEKIDEILVSEEECYRTRDHKNVYVIDDFNVTSNSPLAKEYSSRSDLMSKEELMKFLYEQGVFS